MAVSADGSIVVGNSSAENIYTPPFGGPPEDFGRPAAFTWTRDGGIAEIEGCRQAYDVSLSRHVLRASSTAGLSRWSEADGFESLGVAVGSVRGISEDGNVVVGTSRAPNGQLQAFRWTETGGVQHLGALPATTPSSAASDTSADGSVVIGTGNAGSWIWSAATGMVALTHPTSSVAVMGLSRAGNMHVGELQQLDSAYVYSPAAGYTLIDSVTAVALSGSGRIVVGGSQFANPGSYDAFVWDPINGTRDLKQLLEQTFGLDLTGWTLKAATDVSDDGRTIVGVGIDPNGDPEGWVAVLPPECNDGLDNDGDSLSDATDPQCTVSFWNDEAHACGIGFELALIVPVLQQLYARRRRRASR